MTPKKFILLALLSACPALADPIVVTINNAYGMQGSLWIHDQNGNEPLYFAGGINIVVDTTTRVVFCVDLLTDIIVGQTYDSTLAYSYTNKPYIKVGDYSDVPSLERVGWLLQNEWPNQTGPALQIAGAAL